MRRCIVYRGCSSIHVRLKMVRGYERRTCLSLTYLHLKQMWAVFGLVTFVAALTLDVRSTVLAQGSAVNTLGHGSTLLSNMLQLAIYRAPVSSVRMSEPKEACLQDANPDGICGIGAVAEMLFVLLTFKLPTLSDIRMPTYLCGCSR